LKPCPLIAREAVLFGSAQGSLRSLATPVRARPQFMGVAETGQAPSLHDVFADYEAVPLLKA